MMICSKTHSFACCTYFEHQNPSAFAGICTNRAGLDGVAHLRSACSATHLACQSKSHDINLLGPRESVSNHPVTRPVRMPRPRKADEDARPQGGMNETDETR